MDSAFHATPTFWASTANDQERLLASTATLWFHTKRPPGQLIANQKDVVNLWAILGSNQ